jgi:16S rRNA (guanine527-N7)-methyltransferase
MESQTNALWFRTVCLQNGLQLSDAMLEQFEAFVGLLKEWNAKINLISRRDEESIWSAHILHSVSILLKLNIPLNSRVLDLGTGGGLPGLPLKIARPDLHITLLDSTQKKINVVNEVVRSINLTGARAVWGRAEELGKQPEFSKKYDIAVARAVAPLKDLVRWSVPFLKPQRKADSKSNQHPSAKKMEIVPPAIVALKGGDLDQEIRQTKSLSTIKSIEVVHLTLEGSNQLEEGEKRIVVVNLQHTQERKTGKQ